jgi:hypothetical protein
MKNLFKGKLGTALILTVTMILAGVAIFTAVRLYQLGNQPVAPNVPSSIPHAQEVTATATPTPTPSGVCTLSFTITTSTPTPTPTPVPQCNTACTSTTQCPSTLTCYKANGATSGFCRNAQCSSEISCICSTPTPTPTPTATPTGTPGPSGTPTATPTTAASAATTPGPTAATLPNSGTDWPTIAGAGIGIFVILGSLLLAL